MTVTCVFVKVKKEFVSRFIEATAENHKNSTKENGNLRFDFIQKSDDPTEFMLYEVYSSEEDAAKHKNENHYLVWKETVEKMMEKPRSCTKYNPLLPDKVGQWKTRSIS
ncbi:antibiotic biosynthesis monooxygenase [candidate division WOR-3 bacterium]|nr:antibiotic biosynthesis monooxygenase [candidate division WOR-3 bacterium]